MKNCNSTPWCCAPDVIKGTQCLDNTSNNCTWCGCPMPPPRRQYTPARHREALAKIQSRGTDPIAFERGED